MLQPFKTVLASRNATMMLLASVTSLFGDWAYFIAVSVFLAKNDGVSLLAVIAIIRFACTIALTPFGAALVERWPKRFTMITADVARFALMVLIAATMRFKPDALWLVAALSGLSSLAGIVFGPARRALLPQTVEPGSRLALNALDGSIGTLTLTLAPALAGLGLAVVSPAGVVLINAFSFLGSAGFLLGMLNIASEVPKAKSGNRSLWAETKEGVSFVLRTPDVSAITGLAFVSHIAVGATWIFVPVIVLQLGFPDSGAGYLSSAIGAGSMAGMFIGGAISARREIMTAFTAVFFFTLSMGLWALFNSSEVGAFGSALLIGMTANIFEPPCWSILQNRTDKNLYARVFGAFDAIGLLGMCLGTQISALALKQVSLKGAIASVFAVMAVVYAANSAVYVFRTRRPSC